MVYTPGLLVGQGHQKGVFAKISVFFFQECGKALDFPVAFEVEQGHVTCFDQ